VWAAVFVLMPLMRGFAQAQSTTRLAHSVPSGAAFITRAKTALPAMPMDIAVRLKLRNTAEMEQLEHDQQDPSSPSYHQWLTAEEFNARFGPTRADADTVAQWLKAEGFAVTGIDLDRHVITAKANAAVVAHALDVAIVSNGTLFANTTDPAVPAVLAPLIANIEGLHNTFAVTPTLSGHRVIGPAESDNLSSPDLRTAPGGAFTPADLRTYYDEAALIKGGNAGTKAPDCVALPETSDLHGSSVNAFTTGFRLPPVKLTKVYSSGRGIHDYNDAEIEAALDVEYAHLVAPATPIRLYVGGGVNNLQDGITAAVMNNRCGVISISYAYCGQPGSFFTETLGSLFSQAALQGQTVFVSSGDAGAAGLAPNGFGCSSGDSVNVSEMSAEPDVTSVGGTQFEPLYNAAGEDISTVEDGLDSAWNENDGRFLGATGGGISAVFTRPSWQNGIGVPSGSMRMIPDVALGASGSEPGYYIVTISGRKNLLEVVAGTSIAAPLWAGYTRLIAKASHGSRLGLMNPRLYELGNMGSESGLIDVVVGNNTFHGVTGYFAGPGYDMTTGWGSPDMSILLQSYTAK
jgi:subtilase family serine protease